MKIYFRGWIVILLVASLCKRLITLIIRSIFVRIKGGNFMYIILIEILIKFKSFHVIERSWFPITIYTLVKNILYFCKLWRFLCWGLRDTCTIVGNVSFGGVRGFLANIYDFYAPPLIIFISGASVDLNGLYSESSLFHPLFLQLMILNDNFFISILPPL